MACSSCNRNNRRSNNWGCRKAVQSSNWPSAGSGRRRDTAGCGGYCCGGYGCSWNGCGSCTNCGCNSCSGSCRETCVKCGSATVCSGCSPVYAQPCESGRWAGCGRERGCSRGSGCGCSNGRNCGQNSCFPFYCGPCGPVEPVGVCHHHCHHDCGCVNPCPDDCSCADECTCTEECGCASSCLCREPVYGFFTQVGTVDVNAGGVIPFNGGSTVEGIWKDGGELTLDTAGVYMVTLSADIPENVTLYTELDVRVNGVTNPGGRLVLDKDYTGAPLMANTQTVITVNEGAVLTVTSSEGISFSTSAASQPIVTLSIVKLS